jgi:hypothetical protein
VSGSFVNGGSDGFDNGDTTLKVTVAAGDTPTCTFTDALASVSVSPTSQQYSDLVNLTATFPATIIGNKTPATTATFYVGTSGLATAQNMGSCTLAASGGVLTCTVSNVALLEPSYPPPAAGNMAPGGHTVYAVFSGGDLTVATPSTPLTITQEDARAYYTGQSLFFATSTSANSVQVTLPATIKDISAVPSDPAADGNPGDIRNAQVTMTVTDAITNAVVATTGCSGLTPSLVNPSDSKVGTVVCQPTLPVSSTAGGSTYNVRIQVGSYYVYTEDDFASITVALPLATNFITGGGYLVNPTTAPLSTGVYAGDAGRKTNFGFNVKYNKSGTNLQGNVNVIVRKGSTVYQFKGNNLSSLVVSYCKALNGVITSGSCASAPSGSCKTDASPTCPITATFLGKANLNNATTGVSVAGNLSLQMAMTDWGEPGSTGPGPDTIALTVYNGSSLWFSSQWDGTQTIQKLLDGGNVVAH